MALIISNRVREASNTTGLGAFTLSGTALGYQTFSAGIGEGNTTYYAIASAAGEWEIGLGTITAGQLVRTTVLDSSNAGALVDFAVGPKDVFATVPASEVMLADRAQTLTNKTLAFDDNTLTGVQPTLVSGTNLKTVNSSALLGAGNVAVATLAQGALADTALQPSDIGVAVQAYDADLTTWGAKTAPSGAVVGTTDVQTLTSKTLTTPVVDGGVSGTTAGKLGYASGAVTYGTGSAQKTMATAEDLAAVTGDALVGSDDGAGGSLWTSVAGFIARLRSSAGAALVGFLQAGGVDRTVESKLRELVSVKDFGAVGDGVADDTVALQTALNYWVANTCDLLFPAGGTFLATSPLVATFSSNSTARKRITGYGATISGSTVVGDVLKLTVTGALTLVRNIVVEGLHIQANTAAGYALVMQGPLAGNSFFYNNVIRDVSTSGFGGIALLGNFFESTVQDCHLNCPISASSGYGIFIDTSGGSGGGSGGIISSLTLFQNTTRGGVNGVHVSNTSTDVNIIGGTYLQAWQSGVHVRTAQGGYIKGAHVEANWQSTESPATGQSGIYVIISGSTFTVENTFSVRSTKGQAHAVWVFIGAGGCANLVSGYQFGGNEHFRITGTAGVGAVAIVSGNGTISGDTNVRITQLDGLRAKVPIESKNWLRHGSSTGNLTPTNAASAYMVLLTTNPTINLPTFTPVAGDELEFSFEQAGAGGNTVTWDAGYLPGSFVPTSTYGRISTIRFRYMMKFSSSDAFFWVVVSTGTT